MTFRNNEKVTSFSAQTGLTSVVYKVIVIKPLFISLYLLVIIITNRNQFFLVERKITLLFSMDEAVLQVMLLMIIKV